MIHSLKGLYPLDISTNYTIGSAFLGTVANVISVTEYAVFFFVGSSDLILYDGSIKTNVGINGGKRFLPMT